MACHVEGLGESLLGIGDNNVEGLHGLVLEFSGKAVIGKALSADDGNSLALSGNSVAAELGAAALHELGYLNVKSIGAFIYKSEAEVLLARFQSLVLIH